MSRSGNHHISKPLEALAARLMGPEWRVINQLLKHWPQIAGADLAAHATPVRVKLVPNPQMRERATITVRIPGALAPHYAMMEAQMVERINRVMGYPFVERLIWEHKVGQE